MSSDPTPHRAARAAQQLLTIPHLGWVPTPAQARFLLDFGPEALYGGAAGGGKSVALLMGALQFIDIPGYAALVVRHTLADLQQPDNLLNLTHRLLGDQARWDRDANTYTFSSGATLTLAGIEHDRALHRFQGATYTYIAFDELTQFAEHQYRYLFSRLRQPADGPAAQVPLRMRAATNPGGPGHHWVFERFIEPWRTHQPHDPPLERAFHPARLADNPHLNTDSYLQGLGQLDHITRAQLRDGDWDIRPTGGLFHPDWCTIIGPDQLPDTCRYHVRSWDLAATTTDEARDPDYTVGALMSLDHTTRTYYLRHITRGTPIVGLRHTRRSEGTGVE